MAMYLAGIPIRDAAILELARLVDDPETARASPVRSTVLTAIANATTQPMRAQPSRRLMTRWSQDWRLCVGGRRSLGASRAAPRNGQCKSPSIAQAPVE
jgi:hypothetical protein